jgi:hypothetical protein
VRTFLEQHGLSGIRAEATAPTVEDSFMAQMEATGAPEGQERQEGRA